MNHQHKKLLMDKPIKILESNMIGTIVSWSSDTHGRICFKIKDAQGQLLSIRDDHGNLTNDIPRCKINEL